MPLIRITNITDTTFTDVSQPLPISFTSGLGSGDVGYANVKTEGSWSDVVEIPPSGTAGTIVGDGSIGLAHSLSGFSFVGGSTTEYEWSVAGVLKATTATYTTVSGDASKVLSARVRAVSASGVPSDWINATNTVNVTPASLLSTSNVTTITIKGVNYTVSANSTPGTAVPVGYDLNGNAVIVGNAYIIDTSLPPVTVGSRTMHGIEKNPTTTSLKGYDSLIGDFDATKIATFPIALVPNDLVHHFISRTNATTSDYRYGSQSINGSNVIYCVSTAPPAKQCTPVPHWSTPASRPQLVCDADAIYATLPTAVDTTGMDLPSWAAIKPYIARYDAMYGPRISGNTSNGYEIAGAYRSSGPVQINYGRYRARIWWQVLMGIAGNQWSAADKKEAILWAFTHGGTIYHQLVAKNADIPFSDGGHFVWHQPLVMAYLLWSGQSSLIEPFPTRLRGNYVSSAARWTAERWLQMQTPHEWPGGQINSRLRDCTSVSADGLTIYLQMLRNDPVGDSAKCDIGDGQQGAFGVTLVRVSTGETRVVSAQIGGVDLKTTLDDWVRGARISTPFSTTVAAGEKFYWLPSYPIAHGDMYFYVQQAQACYVNVNQSYWDLQYPAIGIMFLCWLGIKPTWIDNIARMSIRTMLSNTPSADHDYPNYVEGYESYGGAFSFYSTHRDTLLADYLTTPNTVGTISGLSVTPISATQLRVTVTMAGGTNCGLFAVASASGVAAPSAAQIKAGQDGAGATALSRAAKDALAAGTFTFDIENLPTASTAYRVSVVCEDWYGNVSTVLSTTTGTTTLSTGTLYDDFFADIAIGGDTNDLIVGNWVRSSGSFTGKIVADANGPAGRGMQFDTSSTLQSLRKSGLSTKIAAATTLEWRARVKIGASASSDGAIGSLNSSRVNGISIRRGSTANTTSIRIMSAGNLDTGAADTAVRSDAQVLSLISNILDNSYYEIALRWGDPDKKTFQAKCWPVGGTEPAWTTSTTVVLDGAGGAARALVGTSDLTFTDLRIIGHGGTSPIFTMLGRRLMIDGVTQPI